MGLTLPGQLTEPLGWIGLTWPEADEELLYEAGQQWLAFAATLRSVAEPVNVAAGQVWGQNEGQSIDAFHAWWIADDGPQQRLAEDAVAAEIIGTALVIFSGVTLAMKIAFIAQLTLLAFQVGQAIATAFVTFGATTAEIPVFVAATRLACRRLIKEVVDHIQTVLNDLLERAKRLLGKAPARRVPTPAPARSAAQDVFARTRHYGNSSRADFQREFPELDHDVNPQFGTDSAFNINCQSCVIATDQSLAGNAASAVPRRLQYDAAGNPLPDARFDWPNGVDQALGGGHIVQHASGYDDVIVELEAAGDGARGIVHGRRVDAQGYPVAGHVFNAVNRGGTVHFIDGQTGGYAYLEKYAGFEFMRTY